jgi:hypothetical protein
VVCFTDTDDEAAVGVGSSVSTDDEVVCLEDLRVGNKLSLGNAARKGVSCCGAPEHQTV